MDGGVLIRGGPNVRRDLNVGPEGNFHRALELSAAANQRSVDGVGVSTPCVAVSTPGITRFVHGVLELEMDRDISDP